jgi:hypothetical protein
MQVQGWEPDPDNPVHFVFRPQNPMTLQEAKHSLQTMWQDIVRADDKQLDGQFYISCSIPPPHPHLVNDIIDPPAVYITKCRPTDNVDFMWEEVRREEMFRENEPYIIETWFDPDPEDIWVHNEDVVADSDDDDSDCVTEDRNALDLMDVLWQ